MLAAATRLLAMTHMSVLSPPGGHRLRSVTGSYSVQSTVLHRAFVRDQSAFGQRSMSGAAASLILKQYHTCDASHTVQKRRFRVFSIWGNHHRNSFNAQGWHFTCHPCRSLFSSARRKEEEEDRLAGCAKVHLFFTYFMITQLSKCQSISRFTLHAGKPSAF